MKRCKVKSIQLRQALSTQNDVDHSDNIEVFVRGSKYAEQARIRTENEYIPTDSPPRREKDVMKWKSSHSSEPTHLLTLSTPRFAQQLPRVNVVIANETNRASRRFVLVNRVDIGTVPGTASDRLQQQCESQWARAAACSCRLSRYRDKSIRHASVYTTYLRQVLFDRRPPAPFFHDRLTRAYPIRYPCVTT